MHKKQSQKELRYKVCVIDVYVLVQENHININLE